MNEQSPASASLLDLRDVNLVYRALPALRGIDFSIAHGQQWACLGPNGAGKTSLARVISGQATHYSGEMQRSPGLERAGVAYVCFEQARNSESSSFLSRSHRARACASGTGNWTIRNSGPTPATRVPRCNR